uniref:Thioredoxin domain-containing protein n=1 Tax=Brassica oleracea TaxID=3712 RepID=A0A3P6H5G3_BRAOL|nr:unnamed protein product [Brassica oleracea]
MEKIKVLSRLAVMVACLMCLGFSVGMCSESDPLIKTVVSSSLPSNNGDLLYSAKLHTADECKQCRCMDFRLENLDVRYAGRIKFYKMDIHKAPVIAKKIHVTTVPTSIIFRGGGIMGEVLGYNPAKVMKLVERYAHK